MLGIRQRTSVRSLRRLGQLLVHDGAHAQREAQRALQLVDVDVVALQAQLGVELQLRLVVLGDAPPLAPAGVAVTRPCGAGGPLALAYTACALDAAADDDGMRSSDGGASVAHTIAALR